MSFSTDPRFPVDSDSEGARRVLLLFAASLVVVGGDRHRARYVSLATTLGVTDRVRFVGAVDDPLPYLAMADAFVLPTLYDPFPNAALEAFATGLPVITLAENGGARSSDLSGPGRWRCRTSRAGE